ncbi:ATP-binding protein [Peterkaempfera bronchialis]|nr:ATP-binding protein [Peterkaempfera bronchialis]
MTASALHLRFVRDLAGKTLRTLGVETETIEDVRLVASELVGNSVRACGDHVPLVIEVDAGPSGVTVRVHDPDAKPLPRRPGTSLDDDQAESGRGLGLVDLLAPGWEVIHTPVGKQISCRLTTEKQSAITQPVPDGSPIRSESERKSRNHAAGRLRQPPTPASPPINSINPTS